MTTEIEKLIKRALHQMRMENWQWNSQASTDSKRAAYAALTEAADALAQFNAPTPNESRHPSEASGQTVMVPAIGVGHQTKR